jgi:uncharacterized membrane protein
MGLAILILGLAIFIGTHSFVSLRGERERLIARIGEGAYKGAFALVSILGVVLIVYGFRRTEFISIWTPPAFLRHVTEALMWPAFVFLAAAYVPGNIKKVGSFHQIRCSGGLTDMMVSVLGITWPAGPTRSP